VRQGSRMSDKQVEAHAEQCGSVGRVETRIASLALPEEGFRLECGKLLPELQVAYETYGELNERRDNVIFICHALTGDAHAAGVHDDGTVGWWDEMIGPGKGIDTTYYHVVCANILGGCKGTTGPAAVDPRTGARYAADFPPITVGDIVNVHVALLAHLGIEHVAAAIGGSFGGMQVIDWAIRHPDRLGCAVIIASAASLSAQALAFDTVARNVITADNGFRGGDYYEEGDGKGPVEGLAHARQIGHITYLSSEMMDSKFGRTRWDVPDERIAHRLKRHFQTNFNVDSYLEYQGQKFVSRFDANSYLHITRAMDEFDLSDRYGSLGEALSRVAAKSLVVALSSDWLFPPELSRQIACELLNAGRHVSYCELSAPHGHDAFLIEIRHLAEVIRAFLPWVGAHTATLPAPKGVSTESRLRARVLAAESACVADGARVLDLGCGSGRLLGLLSREHRAIGMGVDRDVDRVIDVLDQGHGVFQVDIDGGLGMVPDQAFDYAVISDTLQQVGQPAQVLREMLRVADQAVVAFPNFGYYRHRLQLLFRGRMPMGKALPFEWYDTPNIHLFTYRDFCELCAQEGVKVEQRSCLASGWLGRVLVACGLCNVGAEWVVMRLRRSGGEPESGQEE
jgi:homoserine O-acetyltransferase